MAGGERCMTHDLWEEMGRQIHGYLASRLGGRRAGRQARAPAPWRSRRSGMTRVSKPVYLDYNATAPIRPEARDALLRALEAPAIPRRSMPRPRRARPGRDRPRPGRGPGRGRAGLGDLRQRRHRGQRPGHRQRRPPASSASSSASHRARRRPRDRRRLGPAGLRCCRGRRRRRRLAWLEAELASAGPALVCLMLANNETGVIQPDRRGLGAGARRRRLAACRRRPGGRQDRHRFHRPRRRHPGAVGAQAGRTAGRRRPGRRHAVHARRVVSTAAARSAAAGPAPRTSRASPASARRPTRLRDLALDGQTGPLARRLGRTCQGRRRRRARGGR
jgi:hypothetical protein